MEYYPKFAPRFFEEKELGIVDRNQTYSRLTIHDIGVLDILDKIDSVAQLVEQLTLNQRV